MTRMQTPSRISRRALIGGAFLTTQNAGRAFQLASRDLARLGGLPKPRITLLLGRRFLPVGWTAVGKCGRFDRVETRLPD
jgi:hypothetical protein